MEDQVQDHHNVDEGENDLDPGDVTDDFEEFPGQEGRGEDERYVFGPDLAQDETDALEAVQSGVAEDADADLLEAMGIDESQLVEDEIDESAFGVEPQAGDDARGHVDQVLVQELDGSDAEEDAENGLDKLEGSDGDEPPIDSGNVLVLRAMGCCGHQ